MVRTNKIYPITVILISKNRKPKQFTQLKNKIIVNAFSVISCKVLY